MLIFLEGVEPKMAPLLTFFERAASYKDYPGYTRGAAILASRKN